MRSFFSFSIRKEKIISLSTKERKAKFNTDDQNFRKQSNLPFGTLSAESLPNKYQLFETKSKQIVNFSDIPKKPFPVTPSKKYIMIEEFKDRIKGLKNILNEIKKHQNYLEDKKVKYVMKQKMKQKES